MNHGILYGFCAIVPASTMAAAHWFPWRKLIRRDLHQLEAYAIGTTAIVGTSVAAIAAGDNSKSAHIGYLLTAAASAGVVTLAAWALDAYIYMVYSAMENDILLDTLDSIREATDGDESAGN